MFRILTSLLVRVFIDSRLTPFHLNPANTPALTKVSAIFNRVSNTETFSLKDNLATEQKNSIKNPKEVVSLVIRNNSLIKGGCFCVDFDPLILDNKTLFERLS